MRRFLLSCLLLLSWTALSDGGHIALHATSGSVTITLFTSPEPLVPGRADLSVLVQNAASNELVAGARVQGTLIADRARTALAFAPSGMLMAASIHLPRPGTYRLNLTVGPDGAPPAAFTTTLVVEAGHGRRTTVILAVLFPLAVIALFLVNQRLKSHRHAL